MTSSNLTITSDPFHHVNSFAKTESLWVGMWSTWILLQGGGGGGGGGGGVGGGCH